MEPHSVTINGLGAFGQMRLGGFKPVIGGSLECRRQHPFGDLIPGLLKLPSAGAFGIPRNGL
jgi:hypothetical protein